MPPGADMMSAAFGRGGSFGPAEKGLRGALAVLAVLAVGAGLGALAMVQPLLGFAAAAGVVALWVFVRYRSFGILTIFFLVPLGPLLWLSSDGTISVQKLLIAGLAAIWVVQLLLTKDRTPFFEFTRTRLNMWGLLFLVVFLIPLPWCREKDTALLLMVRWLSHLVLLYFLVFTVRSFSFLRKCLAAVLIMGAVISCVAIWEHYTETSILEMTGRQVQLIKGEATGELVSSKEKTIHAQGEVEWARSMATFKGPNELGLFLILVSGVALFFLFRPGSGLMRAFAALTFVLALISLDFTGSRGALGGFVVMAGVFLLLLRFPFKWFLFAAALLAVPVILASPGSMGDQWRGGLNWDTIRQDERVQWLHMSADMFADYPVAGIGLGQFQPRYFEYRVPNCTKIDEPPHNIVFQIGAEDGIAGLILLLYMIYAVIRELSRLRSRPLEEDHRLLGTVLLAAFAGVMAFSMTSNVLLDETFWTFLSLAAIASSLHAAGLEKAGPAEEEEREVVLVVMPGSPRRRIRGD